MSIHEDIICILQFQIIFYGKFFGMQNNIVFPYVLKQFFLQKKKTGGSTHREGFSL